MLIWADSFEHYGTTVGNLLLGGYLQANDLSASLSLSTVRARTGSISLLLENNATVIRGSTYGNKTTLGMGFGIYMTELPPNNNGRPIFGFADISGLYIVSITINSDGTIPARMGDENGSVITSSTFPLTASSWNHIEAKLVISSTLGEVEVRLNGETVLVATDLNTGTTPISQYLWERSTGNTGVNWNLDDIFIWDSEGTKNNDFIGPARVHSRWPVSDVSPMDWAVIGAATAHEAVDDTSPDGDATCITAEDPGDVAGFTIDSLPADVIQVEGICIVHMSRLTSGGIGSTKAGVISGTEEYQGPEQQITTAYTHRPTCIDLNPDGDIPWTKSAVENAVFTIERIT